MYQPALTDTLPIDMASDRSSKISESHKEHSYCATTRLIHGYDNGARELMSRDPPIQIMRADCVCSQDFLRTAL